MPCAALLEAGALRLSEPSRALCRPDIPAGDVGAALAAAGEFASAAAALGRDSAVYLDTLRSLGAFDLTTARVIEPHLDALAILAEAG
ncbi:MAG TPA: acyl-CoA dehydrogenase, partial [Dermacoccus sp.]|nr:acyl-CoA dehydrogenase [Dermacoccus sp.]